MSESELLHTAAAAEVIGGPWGDRVKCKALLNRWRMKGILPTAGRIGHGPKAEFQFDRRTVAIATILSAVADRANLREVQDLKDITAYLTRPLCEGADRTVIEKVLSDLQDGAADLSLVIGIFYNRADRKRAIALEVQSGAPRLLSPPFPGYESAMQGRIALEEVLKSFVGAPR